MQLNIFRNVQTVC